MARIIVTVFSPERGPIEVEAPDFPEKTYAAGVRDGVMACLKVTLPGYDFNRITREIE